MSDFDLVLRGRRVITRAGEVARCVAVRDGVVVAIEPYEARLEGKETVDLADDEVLLPGLVDTHVHVNEPGRTEWEGFATATRAAAAGGVTTIVDMPLNSLPPTVDVAALQTKRAAAAGQCAVDGKYPALEDVGEGGAAVAGEVYDLSYEQLRDVLLPGEPDGLELGVVELADGSGSLAMILRREYPRLPPLEDISELASWRSYQEKQ